MLIKILNSKKESEILINSLSKFNLILSIVCGTTFFNNIFLAIFGVIFNLVIISFNRLKRYKNIPGSLYLSFILTINFSIPIAWICIRGDEFNFTENFITPLPNEEYGNALWLSIAYLTVAIAIMLTGMIVAGNTIKLKISLENTKTKIKLLPLILVFVFVTLINYNETTRQIIYYSNRYINNGEQLEQSLMAFIFNDTAFLIFFSSIFYSLGNYKKSNEISKYKFIYLLVYSTYVLLAVIGSSKNAILSVFIYLFIYPMSINREDKEVYWPSNFSYIFLFLFSILVYIFSRAYRQILANDSSDFIGGILENIINESNGDILRNSLVLILNRLSSTFSNYVVIFRHFYFDFDFYYALHFIEYSIKSLLNLLLPGTPFNEAYFTTANMLPDVLQKNELNMLGDSSTFWLHANSQSYTLIGFLLISFGPILCLPILFCFGYLYSYLVQKFKDVLIKYWLMFSFTLIFISYGLEAALQTSLHFFIAINIINLLFLAINRLFCKIT